MFQGHFHQFVVCVFEGEHRIIVYSCFQYFVTGLNTK